MLSSFFPTESTYLRLDMWHKMYRKKSSVNIFKKQLCFPSKCNRENKWVYKPSLWIVSQIKWVHCTPSLRLIHCRVRKGNKYLCVWKIHFIFSEKLRDFIQILIRNFCRWVFKCDSACWWFRAERFSALYTLKNHQKLLLPAN